MEPAAIIYTVSKIVDLFLSFPLPLLRAKPQITAELLFIPRVYCFSFSRNRCNQYFDKDSILVRKLVHKCFKYSR